MFATMLEGQPAAKPFANRVCAVPTWRRMRGYLPSLLTERPQTTVVPAPFIPRRS